MMFLKKQITMCTLPSTVTLLCDGNETKVL